jgi:RNA polymerase sigma-70 factor (ECF subfamily)
VGLDALVARQSPGADPVEIVERQAAAEMLERAMRRLEEDQRTAFYLNHFTDMTHAEIAALMQKTVSAVKALVRRAKVRLGELLPRDLID